MNPNSIPPQIPGENSAPAPIPAATPVPPAKGPLPSLPTPNPEDAAPLAGWMAPAEAMLRQPRRVRHALRQAGPAQLIGSLAGLALGFSLIYGVVAGTFSGGEQLWIAPLKIAAGLFLSALICLPSLYIFACLGGSRARLAEVAGLVAGMLTLMTLLLLGFAPVAWVFSQSTESIAAMGALHLGFWLIATFFGLRFLENGLSETAGQSGGGFKTWVIIFVLVMAQMTTALRPILGTAPQRLPIEKKFFLKHWSDCLSARPQNQPATTQPTDRRAGQE